MPITKPNRLNVTAVSSRKAIIQSGWCTSTGTKAVAVARMMRPRLIDLVAAAPT